MNRVGRTSPASIRCRTAPATSTTTRRPWTASPPTMSFPAARNGRRGHAAGGGDYARGARSVAGRRPHRPQRGARHRAAARGIEARAEMPVLLSEQRPIRDTEDVVAVRQAVRQRAIELGFNLVDQTKIVTAASELARNTLQSRRRRRGDHRRARGIRTARAAPDLRRRGPGIADLQLAMKDGFSTGRPRSRSLRRAALSNDFHIESKVGKAPASSSRDGDEPAARPVTDLVRSLRAAPRAQWLAQRIELTRRAQGRRSWSPSSRPTSRSTRAMESPAACPREPCGAAGDRSARHRCRPRYSGGSTATGIPPRARSATASARFPRQSDMLDLHAADRHGHRRAIGARVPEASGDELPLDIGAICVSKPGEDVCGDAWAWRIRRNGWQRSSPTASGTDSARTTRPGRRSDLCEGSRAAPRDC